MGDPVPSNTATTANATNNVPQPPNPLENVSISGAANIIAFIQLVITKLGLSAIHVYGLCALFAVMWIIEYVIGINIPYFNVPKPEWIEFWGNLLIVSGIAAKFDQGRHRLNATLDQKTESIKSAAVAAAAIAANVGTAAVVQSIETVKAINDPNIPSPALSPEDIENMKTMRAKIDAALASVGEAPVPLPLAGETSKPSRRGK